jgi:4'-phosphopantetheinyl transferase
MARQPGRTSPLTAAARSVPSPQGPGLWMLQVATPLSTLRDEARHLVRQALREHLPPWLGTDAVDLITTPGQAPRLAPPHQGVGVSIAHEAGLSLVALHRHGPVGVDLMHPVDMPDALDVARDHMGPEVAQALAKAMANRSATEHAQAFALAWTAYEARLKCLGLPLQEWQAEMDKDLQTCQVQPLALPHGLVGHLAWCAPSQRGWLPE